MTGLTPEEQATVAVYDGHAAGWAARHDNIGHYAQALSRLTRQLPADASVLEVGSGAGAAARWFTGNGYQYAGTDVSAGLLEAARQNVPGALFYHETPYTLIRTFPRERFDAFWATESLLHIPRLRVSDALRGLAAVLKPGAPGFISVKEGHGEGVFPGSNPEDPDRYFTYWTCAGFTTVLEHSGYTVTGFWRHKTGNTIWLNFLTEAPR